MKSEWRVEVLRDHPTNDMSCVWEVHGGENGVYQTYESAIRDVERIVALGLGGYRTRVTRWPEAA